MRNSILTNPYPPDPVNALTLLPITLAAAICRTGYDVVSRTRALRFLHFQEFFRPERVGFIAFSAIPHVAMLARRRLPRTHSLVPLATDQGWDGRSDRSGRELSKACWPAMRASLGQAKAGTGGTIQGCRKKEPAGPIPRGRAVSGIADIRLAAKRCGRVAFRRLRCIFQR